MPATAERSSPLLSIVVPCCNEGPALAATHAEIRRCLAAVDDIRMEFVYVDDGSSDDTLAVLRELAATDAAVGVLSLSRNYGQQVALSAGLEHARGDAVVLLDADLQDPPALIPEMIRHWRDGFEVVYGVRRSRNADSPFKRLSAHLFYRLINSVSEVPMPLDAGDFRLLDRRVVDAVLRMPERDRYLRGIIAWSGFRQRALPYERAPRADGQSKYPLVRMMRLAMDGIFSFSMAPLRLATWMGLLASGLALLGILGALYIRLATEIWVPGWTVLMIAILFLGGVQLVFLGVIGEYLGRIYGEVKRRPLYFVQEQFGLAADAGRRQRAPADRA